MSGINSFWVDDKMYLIDDEVYESFRQLQAKNEELKKQLKLGYENFKVWYDMNKKKHSICMGEAEKVQFFEILQALKGDKKGKELKI